MKSVPANSQGENPKFCAAMVLEESVIVIYGKEYDFDDSREHRQALHRWVERLGNRRVEYWIICSSARSFARTAHSFPRSALLASLARSAALIRSLTRSELMGERHMSTK